MAEQYIGSVTTLLRAARHGDNVCWSMTQSLYCFLFFFQAEDGIRDTSVTGVQTCALPICRSELQDRLALGGAGQQAIRRAYDGGVSSHAHAGVHRARARGGERVDGRDKHPGAARARGAPLPTNRPAAAVSLYRWPSVGPPPLRPTRDRTSGPVTCRTRTNSRNRSPPCSLRSCTFRSRRSTRT